MTGFSGSEQGSLLLTAPQSLGASTGSAGSLSPSPGDVMARDGGCADSGVHCSWGTWGQELATLCSKQEASKPVLLSLRVSSHTVVMLWAPLPIEFSVWPATETAQHQMAMSYNLEYTTGMCGDLLMEDCLSQKK